jgi:exonuclease SbcD
MIKIMHISDIHLGATLKGASYGKEFSSRRQREIKDTFFNALKYSNDNNVDYLIISGDLFDTELMKMSDVNNVFKGLGELDANVLIITGNHDPLKSDSFWNTVKHEKNIYIFKDEVSKLSFPKDNLEVYGHSWNRYYISEKVFDDVPNIDYSKINILIAHGDIYTKKTNYLPIDKKNLVALNFDYVALGHIHKQDFITDRISYPGSLEPFDFSETGKHGFNLIELDKKNINATFIPFAKREFIVKDIELDGEMTENDIYTLINNVDSNENKELNMYRIVFKGRYNYQIDLDKNYLSEIFSNDFSYIEFKNKAKFDFDIDTLKQENKDNIIGKYIERFDTVDLDNEINKQAFNLGIELLLNSKEGIL